MDANKIDALIGYTGFVGSNILKQLPNIQAKFNSKNIEEIQGKSFDTIYCAGAPGVKWLANKEPEKDLEQINRLISCLQKAKANRLALISTIDVYPKPLNVDEDTAIPEDNHAYGRHRLLLEQFVSKNFDHVILRLPALFGPGLKKNIIFDFMNDNNIEQIHQDGQFQFYNIENLSSDIKKSIEHNLKLINISTEPISVSDLVNEVFNNGFTNDKPVPGPRYDYGSKHASIWGNSGKYQYLKVDVISDIKAFTKNKS